MPGNPNYRAQVSEIFNEYVPALIDENEYASKITEEIVDSCSIEDLREIMQSYEQLKERAVFANDEQKALMIEMLTAF